MTYGSSDSWEVVVEASERYERGMQVRREVLGDEHVDRATARTGPLDRAFQDYITGAAWADVWAREGLDRSTRSLLTIVLLAAFGHDDELEMHLRAAKRTGATPEAIAEALLHVALYTGVPAANRAFAVLKRVEEGGGRSSGGTAETGVDT